MLPSVPVSADGELKLMLGRSAFGSARVIVREAEVRSTTSFARFSAAVAEGSVLL